MIKSSKVIQTMPSSASCLQTKYSSQDLFDSVLTASLVCQKQLQSFVYSTTLAIWVKWVKTAFKFSYSYLNARSNFPELYKSNLED